MKSRTLHGRSGFADWAVIITCYVLPTAYALLIILPILTVIAIAVSEEPYVLAGVVGLVPRGIQFRSFQIVLTRGLFLNSLMVSILVTVSGTIGAILLTSVTAYCISKKHLPLIKGVVVLYIVVMLFDGGIVPNYLVIRTLGLLNTPFALILPRVLSVFYLLILKSYFEGLPESMEESAQLDGASSTRIVFSIVLPASIPALATVGLFYTVDYWNSYFDALMYITRASLKPLQLHLREVVIEAAQVTTATLGMDDSYTVAPASVRSATVLLSMVPMVALYPWLQRFFAKGATLGAVKG